MSISTNTRLTLTLGAAITCAVTLVVTGWRAANLLRDIRDEISSLRREVQTVSSGTWSVQDQERWAYQLRWDNRSIPVVVPDPASVRKTP
ncbi:hypothetical protein Ga0100231_024165 [Opitutaceae bacterium TAV4]|nr:hypothetical protein Ga0100231_024165 [Opitutaceae bacterium TAV4]RRK00807.1 hypothetical protein Ga0100230_023740 [Opitutaceae bacterium TAV3]